MFNSGIVHRWSPARFVKQLLVYTFDIGYLAVHNKNPNPSGFGFLLLLVYTLDITFRHLKQPAEFQKVKYFVRKFRQPTVHR